MSPFKMISKCSAAWALALGLTATAHACPELGAGGANNDDCSTVLANAFMNEGTRPSTGDIDSKIFKVHAYPGNRLDRSAPLSRVSFIRGKFLFYSSSQFKDPNNELSVIDGRTSFENGVRWLDLRYSYYFEANSVQSSELTDNAECTHYVAKKWKNFLITWYGCKRDLNNSSPETLAPQLVWSSLTDPADLAYSERLSLDQAVPLLSGEQRDQQEAGALSIVHLPQSSTVIRPHLLPILDMIRGNFIGLDARQIALERLLKLEDERVSTVAKQLLDDPYTPKKLKETIIAGAQYPELGAQLAQIISNGTYEEFRPAMVRAAHSRIKGLVLPISDRVSLSESTHTIRMAAWALGEIGLDAKPTLKKLKLPEFYNHSDEGVRYIIRTAVESIEVQVTIAGIARGEAAALTWAEDLIQTNDGKKQDIVLQILKAYRATTVPRAAKTRISAFLRKEINAGYHEYDNERMTEMRKSLAAVAR